MYPCKELLNVEECNAFNRFRHYSMLGDLTLNLHHSLGLVLGLTCAPWNHIGPPSRSFQTCCAPRQCVSGSGRIFNTSNRAQSRSEHLISSLQAWPLESAIFQASRSDLAVSAASHGPADTAFNKDDNPKPASTRNARHCKCQRTDSMAMGENLRWGLMVIESSPSC